MPGDFCNLCKKKGETFSWLEKAEKQGETHATFFWKQKYFSRTGQNCLKFGLKKLQAKCILATEEKHDQEGKK